jgi:hypothetical protein
MKRMTMIGAILVVAVTVSGQVVGQGELGGAALKPPVENLQFDGTTQAAVRNAPDNDAKLAAIRALTPTTPAQSNWLANMEAMVLADQGQEEEAVAAARRISDPEGAAMTELRVRFNVSNYTKAIEVGESWLAKPKEEFSDVYRMRMADAVTKAMKASDGDTPATESNSVRVLTAALSTIGHTTFKKHAFKDTVAVSGLVKDMVKTVRDGNTPQAEKEAMFQNLVRVTPVTKRTVKTVGEWKGWLAWHGKPETDLNDLVVGNENRKLVDIHAADEVSRALEKGAVSDGPARSNCVRVLTAALNEIERATLFKLGYVETNPVPRLVVRLVKFVKSEGAPNAAQEAMLRHLIETIPVTPQTVKTLGEWKGWLARHGCKDVVLNDSVEGENSVELLNIYAEHTERNIPLPYANSLYGEAYKRGDLAAMRRYLDLSPK